MTHNISIHTGAAQPRCPFSLLPIYSAGVAGEVTFVYICGMKRESFVRLMVRGAADFLLGLAWEPLCPVCRAVLGNAADVMCPQCMLELPRTMMWLSGPSGRFADVLANAVAPPGFAAAWFDYDPSAPSAELIQRGQVLRPAALGTASGRDVCARCCAILRPRELFRSGV